MNGSNDQEKASIGSIEPDHQADEKELERLRQRIKDERPNVDKKPYSHNIISLTLREINHRFGQSEARKAIKELKLEKLGWSLPD